LLAYAYSYQLTSVVVSLALAGLGLGAFIGLKYVSKIETEKLMFAGLVLLGVSFPWVFIALLLSPSPIVVAVCSVIPFLIGGALLSRCYACFEKNVAHRAYCLDVLG
jgi:hypothetical protein